MLRSAASLSSSRISSIRLVSIKSSCQRSFSNQVSFPLTRVRVSNTAKKTCRPSSMTILQTPARRTLSSNNNSKPPPPKGESGAGAEETTQELVLTPGQKVVAGTRLTMYAGMFALAGICAYYIGKELLPTKMSPNTVFDKAFAVIREHSEVKRRFGEPLKAYGRDHGGHREGRRNFIEHTEYKDKDDGSNRTRVRFNLEGQFGTAFVFAEVSSDMPSGEFVYILVQDKRNGQVINVVDNRSSLLAQRMAGGSAEGRKAFQDLLGGGK